MKKIAKNKNRVWFFLNIFKRLNIFQQNRPICKNFKICILLAIWKSPVCFINGPTFKRVWWIYQRIYSPRFLGFGFRGFGFCDLKQPHKPRLQNRWCLGLKPMPKTLIGNNKNRMAFTSFTLSFGFKFENIRFSRLHRFSRLPLKKPIAVPKQKLRALLHWLCFFSLIDYTTPI